MTMRTDLLLGWIKQCTEYLERETKDIKDLISETTKLISLLEAQKITDNDDQIAESVNKIEKQIIELVGDQKL
jgi:hypothetical protein